MNNKLIGVLAFTAGASIGVVATWKLLEKKHEEAMQEEIDSIKKDSEIIDLKKQISSEKITVQKYERKLNQKILTKDYEIIKVSPADSAYSHVIEFLNGFNPEPEE